MNMVTFETAKELDEFDAVTHFINYGSFVVYIEETGEFMQPSFTVKQNGDVDGLEGWNWA